MSVVVAYNSRFGVFLGSDSMRTIGDDLRLPAEPKVWSCGDLVYGIVGDSADITKIRALDLPDRLTNEDPMTFVHQEIMPLLERGELFNSDRDSHNWELVVGHPLAAVCVDSFGAAERFDVPFIAVGSGSGYALGCAFMIQTSIDNWQVSVDDEMDAAKVVGMCVQAACEFDPACGGDVHVEYTDMSQE